MNFFRNMKLAKKISILSVSFFIFLLIIGFTSIRQISKVNSQIMELNNSRMQPIIEMENIKSNIESLRALCNNYMDATDDNTRKTVEKSITDKVSAIDKSIAKYKSDAEFKTLIANYNSFIKAKDTFMKAQSSGTRIQAQTANTGSNTDLKNIVSSGPPTDISNLDKTKLAVVTSFESIINKHVAAANQTYNESKQVYLRTIISLIILIAVCAVITILLSIVIIKSIIAPVDNVSKKLKEISQSNGDLTQRIGYESQDEIGELSSNFDLFMDKLQLIIREVAVSAETISSSSFQLNKAAAATTQSLEDISKTVVNIASGTSDGAAAAEETTASLTEAAKFSEATSKASKNTTNNSKRAQEAAEDSAAKISEIVSSINDIAESSKDVSCIINELDDSSKKIGDIIKIITAISEQTNLLALNAAIEAARAGEAGKGFNVVADEIRKLADESNNAAREISELVKENQVKSAYAVNSVDQVEKKVFIGVTKTSEVGKSIENIIMNIQNIVNEIEQIDNANEQQAQSSKEIERAISSIASTSNEIAGGTENMSAGIQEQLSTMTEIEKTTEQLSEMSNKLSKITSGFKV